MCSPAARPAGRAGRTGPAGPLGAGRATAVLTAILAAAALVAGCTRENSPQARPTNQGPSPSISVPPGSPSPLPVAATAAPANGQELTMEINDIRADASGLAVLRLTATNTGAQSFDLERAFADENRDSALKYDFSSCTLAASGVTLTDPEGQLRYHPLYRTDGDDRYCMNARWGGRTAGSAVEPGQSLILFGTYVVPDDVQSVTVEIPGYEPVEDIPVTR